MKQSYTLDTLLPGQSGVVSGIGCCGGLEARLRDMGLSEGCRVECVRISPLGDPKAYTIRGAVIALRVEQSRGITVWV